MKTMVVRHGIRLSCLLAFCCSAANAMEWYVNDATGNDSGDGMTPETAKKHIQAAVDLAAAGDTVYVAPGVYDDGDVQCSLDSSPAARVVITNKINLVATGARGSTVISGADTVRGIYVYNQTQAAGTIIRGFTICNCRITASSGDNGIGAGAVIPSSYLVDCIVSNNVSAAYRGGGCRHGVAIRCLFANNYSAKYGSAAYQTSFLNSVIVFQRGAHSLFGYVYNAINCTIVGNTIGNYYSFQNSTVSNLRNTIFAANTVQEFGSADYVVASNCVFSAGTTGCSDAKCGSISTEVPDYCFAAPAMDDWRPTAAFGIGSHGDAKFLSDIALPAELEDERYIDYAGNPIPHSGAITCGAVQSVCPATRSLLTFSGSFIVDGHGTIPSANAYRYAWTDSYHQIKLCKAGATLANLMWYSLSTNGTAMSSFYPYTNNWAVLSTLPDVTNTVSVVVPDAAYYVDEKSGDDEYAGSDIGSADHPYATIQAAIDGSSNGTSKNYKSYAIIVREGEYRTGGTAEGRVDIYNKNGNNVFMYKNFRIVSEKGPEKTIIVGGRGSNADGYGTGQLRCARILLPSLVQGFTLTGGHSSGSASALLSNSIGNGHLADCIITNNFSGTYGTAYKAWLIRCRLADNRLTAANAAELNLCRATMCEIVQSNESHADSYAVFSDNNNGSYLYFCGVKGLCHAKTRCYASIVQGGQTFGSGAVGAVRYSFAHGNAFSGTVAECLSGKSRCLDFAHGDFRLRSDSPAIGMVTVSPVAWHDALTFDMDGNMLPMDSIDGWTAGPRQLASAEYVPRGLMLLLR